MKAAGKRLKAKRAAPVGGSRWAVWVLPVLVLLAAAPLGSRYLMFLTRLPQYEFTVVFLLAWVGIVVLRRKEYFVEAPRSSRIGVGLAAFALLSLATGALITSSWFIYLAFILGVGSLFAFAGNWAGSYPLFPVWASLLIPLRPPLGYDQAALNNLRLIASEGASRIADLIGIPHLLQGNVFYLADKQMFMDDACSGIISLLTCMACAALIGIWRRRGTVHFLLLVAAGGFWAVIFNIARVETLLGAWHWFSIDLTSGWKHDVLGYIALTGGVLLLLACDLGFHWLLQDTSEIRSTLTNIWNRRFANPDPRVVEETAPKGNPWQAIVMSLKLTRGRIVLAGALLLLVVAQTPNEIKAWNLLGKKSDFSVAEIRPAPLPESIGAWQHAPGKDDSKIWRLGHEIKSSQATYMRGKDSMVLAIAYPYDHFHDITMCYELGNWKIDKREAPAEKLKPSERNPTLESIMRLEMHRDEVETATVLFAFIDPSGKPIRAPRDAKNIGDAMRNRFGFNEEARPDFKGFLVQVLWPRTSGAKTSLESKEQLELFERVLDQVRVEWTRKVETKP